MIGGKFTYMPLPNKTFLNDLQDGHNRHPSRNIPRQLRANEIGEAFPGLGFFIWG
jgi:hypothetical protein